MQKNSIVTKFCYLALGGPVIMPHSPCKAYITIAIRLRYDYDTTIRRKTDVNFLLASNGSRLGRARYVVVVSQSNRNFDHFRRNRIRRGIVVYNVS